MNIDFTEIAEELLIKELNVTKSGYSPDFEIAKNKLAGALCRVFEQVKEHLEKELSSGKQSATLTLSINEMLAMSHLLMTIRNERVDPAVPKRVDELDSTDMEFIARSLDRIFKADEQFEKVQDVDSNRISLGKSV